jgi:hypothetical protein
MVMRVGVMVGLVVVVMVVGGGGVGTGFGVEGGVDGVGVAAEAGDHVGNHVVGADQDAAAGELHGQMAIAEVPGDAHQLGVVVGGDPQKGFGAGADADEGAIFQRQRIAVAQADGVGKIEKHRGSGDGFEKIAAAEAAVEIDEDAVGGFGVDPGAGWVDAGRAESHGRKCSFLKKRTKKFLAVAYAAGESATAQSKVFCFFSSEKKTFLPLKVRDVKTENTFAPSGGFGPARR